jgi:hypothetical protein
MTHQELMELRSKALADPACAPFIEARDCQKLAELLSVGRTRLNDREIGYGSIIETLGIVDGNTLIDHIEGNPALKYVVPLLAQGRLRIGSPVTQGAVQSFVSITPTVLTQANADKLKALGQDLNPYTPVDVAAALFSEE